MAELAHQAGALVVVDNTFLSPAWQQPLRLGADLVVHSTTKYINGHSDVVGGAVVAKTRELHERLAEWANCLGLTGCALRQLPDAARPAHAACPPGDARPQRPGAGRMAGAATGSQPGLVPGAARRTKGTRSRPRQQRGFGAIIAFELTGGIPAVKQFVSGLRCITLAESLGGVESLVAHPVTMTHAAMDPDARQEAGLTDGLLRMSVGIEDLADLQADMQAGPGARSAADRWPQAADRY